MGELTEIFEKIKLENFITYLLCGADSNKGEIENYEQILKESYNIFFDKLENMYPETNRNDDKLFNLLTDFAMTHEEIYFEVGVLIGFQLYKNMEHEYKKYTNSNK